MTRKRVRFEPARSRPMLRDVLFLRSSVVLALLAYGCGSQLDLGAHDTTATGPGGTETADGGTPGTEAGGGDAGPGSIAPAGILPVGGAWIEASRGLEGGDIRAVSFDRADPKRVYAATWGSGLFRSADGGMTWTAASAGLEGRHCASSVVAHPARAGVAYASVGTCSRRPTTTEAYERWLVRSTDGGASWTRIGSALTDFVDLDDVARVAVVASSPSTLYLATAAGVRRSDDDGATFVLRGKPPLAGNARLTGVEADPKNVDVVYATSNDGKLWKSTNGGTSWGALAPEASGVTVSESDSLTVLAPGAGLSWSRDGGQTFAPSTFQAGTNAAVFSRVLLAPSAPARAYAGTWSSDGRSTALHASDDGGKTFRTLAAGITPSDRTTTQLGLRSWAVDPSDAARLLVGAGAIRLSRDGGATLEASPRGILDRDVDGIAISPSSPSVMYATSTNALFASNDGGASWTRTAHAFPAEANLGAVAVHPTDPRTVYVGLDWAWNSGGSSQVLKSIDGGATFQDVRVDVTTPNLGWFRNIQRLVVDPQQPQTVYAFGQGRLMVSRNEGVTWGPITLPACAQEGTWGEVAFDPRSNDRLWVTAYTGALGGVPSCVLRSTDRGASFTVVKAGVAGVAGKDAFEGGPAYGVLHDPKKPATLYACVYAGLYRSTDDGQSWSSAMIGAPAGASCAGQPVASAEGDRVLATFDDGNGRRRLFATTDGATSWKEADGLDARDHADSGVRRFVAHPTAPSTIFVALRSHVGVAVTRSLGLR